MSADKKQLLRFQILDKCFADTSKYYTFDDLKSACGTSRATLRRDLKCIRETYGDNIFAQDNHQGHKLIYRYSTPGFSICQNELNSTRLAHLKRIVLLLNKFRVKPQLEYR